MAGGGEIELEDDAGVLRARLSLQPPGTNGGQADISFTVDDIVGQPVVKVLPALRLLNTLRPPYEVQIRGEVGAAIHAAMTPEEDQSFIDDSLLHHLENLGTIQDLAQVTVTVPESIVREWAQSLDELLRMRAGEVINGTWTDIKAELNTSRSRLTSLITERGALAMEKEIRFEVDGEKVSLGTFCTIVKDARLADNQPRNTKKVVFVPGDDNTYVQRAGPLVRDAPLVTTAEPGTGRIQPRPRKPAKIRARRKKRKRG